MMDWIKKSWASIALVLGAVLLALPKLLGSSMKKDLKKIEEDRSDNLEQLHAAEVKEARVRVRATMLEAKEKKLGTDLNDKLRDLRDEYQSDNKELNHYFDELEKEIVDCGSSPAFLSKHLDSHCSGVIS